MDYKDFSNYREWKTTNDKSEQKKKLRLRTELGIQLKRQIFQRRQILTWF